MSIRQEPAVSAPVSRKTIRKGLFFNKLKKNPQICRQVSFAVHLSAFDREASDRYFYLCAGNCEKRGGVIPRPVSGWRFSLALYHEMGPGEESRADKLWEGSLASGHA